MCELRLFSFNIPIGVELTLLVSKLQVDAVSKSHILGKSDFNVVCLDDPEELFTLGGFKPNVSKGVYP